MNPISLLEAALLCCIFLAGALLALSMGLRGWALLPGGMATGIAYYVTVGAGMVVLGLDAGPGTVMATVMLSSMLVASAAALRHRVWSWQDVSRLLVACLALGLACVMFFPLVDGLIYLRHVDSAHYLSIGTMLANGTYDEGVKVTELQARLLSVALLHSPANILGEYHVRLILPATSLLILALMAWMLLAKHSRPSERAAACVVIAIMIVSLLSSNRFIMHSFYINGHLLAGLFMLVIAGCGWLMVSADEKSRSALVVMQTLAVPALVLTRPEGAILAGISLAPSLVAAGIPRRLRVLLMLTLGGWTVLWHGYLAFMLMSREISVPVSVSGLLLAGVSLMLASPLLTLGVIQNHAKTCLLLFEAGLWIALMFMFATEPQVLLRSMSATLTNIDQYWGWSLLFLGISFLVVLAVTRSRDLVFLRFPVTTYVPVVLLLAYMRDGEYRVGGGDSLNRMLISILPLLVLSIGAAAMSDRLKWPGVAAVTAFRRRAVQSRESG